MQNCLFRLLIVASALLFVSGCTTALSPKPLPRAHAHNDYEHARPLVDALEHGFCNIEADVWLVEGQLLVAHDKKNVQAGRTLEALYLDPLRERVKANGGRVYRGWPTITLLIDVKSEAYTTYAALEAALSRYADMLTVYENGRERAGAVAVVVSGNRSLDAVKATARRYSALDGRSTDLDSAESATVYPWISENWTKLSKWKGQGPLPEADRVTLRDWVRRAHAKGRKLRFWNYPETPEAWRILAEEGVDVIGTDDLSRLRDFLAASAR